MRRRWTIGRAAHGAICRTRRRRRRSLYLYGYGSPWDNWRRNTDYYGEGDLVWLDVDTTIRKLTNDKKSLNDFLAAFEGLGGNTGTEGGAVHV